MPYGYKGNNNYFNIIDITDYLPKEYALRKNQKYFNSKMSSPQIMNDNDPIANNPNNYFFNKGLEMLSKLEKEESRN